MTLKEFRHINKQISAIDMKVQEALNIENIIFIKNNIISLAEKYDTYDLITKIVKTNEYDNKIKELLYINNNPIDVSLYVLNIIHNKANIINLLNNMIDTNYDKEFISYICVRKYYNDLYTKCLYSLMNNEDQYQNLFKYLDSELAIYNRIKKVNNLINSTFKNMIIDHIKMFHEYDICINCSEQNFQLSVNKLFDAIHKRIRYENINKIIKKLSNDSKLYNNIVKCDVYDKFINNLISYDDAVIGIKKFINNYNESLLNEKKILKLTNKYIGKEYIELTKTSVTYKKYLSGELNNLKIDKILDRIIDEVADINEHNSRFISIQDEIKRLKIYDITDITSKFIYGDDDFNEIINELKNVIAERHQRHMNIMNYFINIANKMVKRRIKNSRSYNEYIKNGGNYEQAIDDIKKETYIDVIDNNNKNNKKNNDNRVIIHNNYLEKIIQDFINMPNNEIILEGYTNFQRKFFHIRFEQIGYGHVTSYNGDMKITKQ